MMITHSLHLEKFKGMMAVDYLSKIVSMEKDTHISCFIEDYKLSCNSRHFLMTMGIKEIDDAVQGLNAGEMVVLLGDPGSGKTSLTIRMVDSLSVDRKIPSLYMCLRNTPKDIIRRLVNYRSASEYEHEETIQELGDSPLYLYESPSIQIDELCDVCRQHVKEFGVKIVFVHYLYINSGSDNAFKLRLLAKELGISIVVLMNIFEFREGIEGVLPCMRDLYDNYLGEYSDTVIGLCDYASYHIFMDDNGRDLRDLLHVSILKCHGEVQDNRFYVHKDSLRHKSLVTNVMETN